MENLKLDIYNYFLPMASDPQTAAVVTYAIIEMVQHHMSEYVDIMDRLLNLVTELGASNEILQNRVQDSEELALSSVRMAYDTILSMSEQQVGERRLDTLEEFQKEL